MQKKRIGDIAGRLRTIRRYVRFHPVSLAWQVPASAEVYLWRHKLPTNYCQKTRNGNADWIMTHRKDTPV